MNTSLYLNRDTWIHRLDARTKALVVLVFFILALLYSNPLYLLAVLSIVLLGVGISQAFDNLVKIWILLLMLFLYSVMLWPFFFEGSTPIVEWASLLITSEGVAFGIAMGIRLNVMVISGVLLLSTTTLEDFSAGLQRFGVPSSLGFAFSLAFRWVPTLLGSSSVIVQAQRSRGLDLSSGTLVEKVRGYVPLVVPLIGHMLRQTTLLAMALESKGFSPEKRRHAYHQSVMGCRDMYVLVVASALLGISWWVRMKGYGV